MKSKSLIAGSLIVASLAPTGNAGTREPAAMSRPAPAASYAAPGLPGGLDVGQIIQSMNDTNAMNVSMTVAEQQNDAANAATLQTEINANN